MKNLIFALVCAASFSANAERIHCRFEPDMRPTTYLIYDTKQKVAETLSGWNDPTCPKPGRSRGILLDLEPQATAHQCLRSYKNVVLTQIPDVGPYYKEGMSLVGFDGDVVMLHMRMTHNATVARADGKIWPFEALWGDERLPANPDIKPLWFQKWKTKGICWTDSAPEVPPYSR